LARNSALGFGHVVSPTKHRNPFTTPEVVLGNRPKRQQTGKPMSRYFFHVQDGSPVLDNEGLELPNLDAAREEAIRSCGELVRELPKALKKGDPFRLWVTDEPNGRGRTIFTVKVAAENG
jgi:hypothetical protein